MSLANVVFKANPTREVEVMGHKIVVRGLTTRDALEMDVDPTKFTDEGKEPSTKDTIKGMIEYLAACIISIDGNTPDSKNESREFLYNQDQSTIIEIFAAINKSAIQAVVETKKFEGTQP